jgi:hypothetical protein
MLRQWHWDNEVGSVTLDVLFAHLVAKLVPPGGQLSNLVDRWTPWTDSSGIIRDSRDVTRLARLNHTSTDVSSALRVGLASSVRSTVFLDNLTI